jgi:transcriptional regulator with XRE-family HTH domain
VTVAGYQTVAQRNLTCAIRIRERRRELGLTQAEVVERVDRLGSRLSNQALSAIENGRRLAVGRLPDLAAALDCTVTYLLGLATDPHRWTPDEPGTTHPPEAASSRSSQGQDVHRASSRSPRPGPGPAATPTHRSWILGPDVPDIPGELRSRTHETLAPTSRRPR